MFLTRNWSFFVTIHVLERLCYSYFSEEKEKNVRNISSFCKKNLFFFHVFRAIFRRARLKIKAPLRRLVLPTYKRLEFTLANTQECFNPNKRVEQKSNRRKWVTLTVSLSVFGKSITKLPPAPLTFAIVSHFTSSSSSPFFSSLWVTALRFSFSLVHARENRLDHFLGSKDSIDLKCCWFFNFQK